MKFYNKAEPIGSKTVVALGYFDGVHLGHREVIEKAVRAAKQKDALSAVLTFDMSARRANGKGSGDLDTYEQRAKYMENLGLDVLVQLDFDEIADMTSERFVSDILGNSGLNAVSVCCGADFRFGAGRSGDIDTLRELCDELDIDVIIVSEVELDDKTVSTTQIKRYIELGEIERAEAMLGHPYGFSLEVCGEKKLARKLGFPTINQRIPDHLAMPRFGVYLSRAEIEGKSFYGISNIGVRPTVSSDGSVMLETNIFDFDGDLYGRTIEVHLLSFMRDERRFENPEKLRAQVMQDIEKAKKLMIRRMKSEAAVQKS
ncbi:MAG: bifunctional riboflavin kinase/FAD synthetase [Oscillospiraceae bacterium]